MAAWLFKVVVGFGLLAVIVFDAGAIAVNHITLDSAANDIAVDLSPDVTSANMTVADPRVQARGRELARAVGARLVNVSVDEAGTLRVRVARDAETIVIARVDALKRWGRAVAGGRSGTL